MTVCQYPWLVRYGVAADHQGTKAMIRQFALLFEKQCVVFAGNLSIGSTSTSDLSETALQEMFDVVVLALVYLRIGDFGLPVNRSRGSMAREHDAPLE